MASTESEFETKGAFEIIRNLRKRVTQRHLPGLVDMSDGSAEVRGERPRRPVDLGHCVGRGRPATEPAESGGGTESRRSRALSGSARSPPSPAPGGARSASVVRGDGRGRRRHAGHSWQNERRCENVN